jgi:hypothetical protein
LDPVTRLGAKRTPCELHKKLCRRHSATYAEPPCLFSNEVHRLKIAPGLVVTKTQVPTKRTTREDRDDQQVSFIKLFLRFRSMPFHLNRYCFQAAATQGVAASLNTQDCPSYAFYYRYYIRSNWCATAIGKWFGIIQLFILPV